MITEVMEVAN